MAVQNIMYQGISFLATVRNGFIQLVKVSGTKYDQLTKCSIFKFLKGEWVYVLRSTFLH